MSECICIQKEEAFQWRTEIRTLSRTLGAHVPECIVWIEQGADWSLVIEGSFKVLVVKEKDRVPSSSELNRCDAVVGYPFRVTEFLSVIRNYHDQQEFKKMASEFSEMTLRVKSDGERVENKLFQEFPDRFPAMKGIKVKTRHLTGLRPGGDYLDVYESKDKEWVQILMTDSSNYGVSSRLLGMMLSASSKMANEMQLKSYDWIQAMKDELRSEFSSQDHFSVFLGRLNRADFSLHYQVYGNVKGFVFRHQGDVESLKASGPEIYFHSETILPEEQVVVLQPKDRLVVISDGFEKVLGREWDFLNEAKKREQLDPFFLVNEMVYQVKSKLVPGETFPAEDCSVLVFEMGHRVLRLAPTG